MPKWLKGIALAIGRFGICVWKTLGKWRRCSWADLKSPRGYRGIAVIVAAYAGFYSIVEARHERQMNLAAFERNMFITMVESGNQGSFVAAMKNFGPIQTKAVFSEPFLFEPLNWWDRTKPNIEPLLLWAQHRLRLCKRNECGHVDPYRLDLSGSDLREAVLSNVGLSNSFLMAARLGKADLTGAELNRAYLLGADLEEARLDGANLYDATLVDGKLFGAELEKANMVKAVLEGADLREANLEWAVLAEANLRKAKLSGAKLAESDLAEADLRGVSGLTCAQLQDARNWHSACRDAELACGADIPEPETCK